MDVHTALAAYVDRPAAARWRVSKLPHAERLELIERDDGAPDDMVYYSSALSRHAYHDDAECHLLENRGDKDRLDNTREAAQRRVLVPCSRCVLDDEERRTDIDPLRFHRKLGIETWGDTTDMADTADSTSD